MSLIETLTSLLEHELAQTPWLCEGVTVVSAGRRRVVTVTLDRVVPDRGRIDTPTPPLSLDEVAEATRVIDGALAEVNQLGDGPYTLEVTSRGVGRPLTAPRHFRRNVGRLLTVTTAEASVTGRLRFADEETFVLATERGEVDFSYAAVTRAVVEIEFSRTDSTPPDPTEPQGSEPQEG